MDFEGQFGAFHKEIDGFPDFLRFFKEYRIFIHALLAVSLGLT